MRANTCSTWEPQLMRAPGHRRDALSTELLNAESLGGGRQCWAEVCSAAQAVPTPQMKNQLWVLRHRQRDGIVS